MGDTIACDLFFARLAATITQVGLGARLDKSVDIVAANVVGVVSDAHGGIDSGWYYSRSERLRSIDTERCRFRDTTTKGVWEE